MPAYPPRPPRRSGPWSPGRREWRRALIALFGAALLAAGLVMLGGAPSVRFGKWPSFANPRVRRPVRATHGSAPQAVLAHRVSALRALVASSRDGHLFPPAPGRAVIAVDQRLVAELLAAYLPVTHVVAGRFRVHLIGARVEFEGGLALIRLDGRVGLVDDAEVFADLTVFGDLGIAPHQPQAQVLRGRVHVIAVEARQVAVGVKSRAVDRLVEEVGQARLEDLARLGPELDIPVRRAHAFEIPGLEGPVQIEPARVEVALGLAGVRALQGRLLLAVDIGAGGLAPAAAPPAGTFDHGDAAAPPGRATAVRAEHDRLQQVVEAQLEGDPVMSALEDLDADVAFLVPEEVASAVGTEVVRRYLDRVRIVLGGLQAAKEGDMDKETAVGRMRAGRWTLKVQVERVAGVLRAGRPTLRLQRGVGLGVRLPVHIESGRGAAVLDFAWDSAGVANLVCRDFEVHESVEATVVKEEHVLVGAIALRADGDTLRLLPSADRTYRIHITPDDAAWEAARAAIAGQDKWWKCGLGVNPADVQGQLERLVARGVVVKLPARLFRPLSVDIAPSGDLDVEGTKVRVSTSKSELVVGSDHLVFGTRLKVDIPGH